VSHGPAGTARRRPRGRGARRGEMPVVCPGSSRHAFEATRALRYLALIPISAIVARAYTRGKQLQGQGLSAELRSRLEALEAGNADLRVRLENVEVIVSDGDWVPPAREDATASPSRTVAPRRRTRS